MKKSLRSLLLIVGLVMGTAAQAGILGELVTHGVTSGAKHIAGKQINTAPVELPSAKQGFSACPEQFPKGQPFAINTVNAQWQAHALCSNNFAVLYSALSKTPLVVTERLSKAQLSDAAGEERTDVFFADPRLLGIGRAELDDFKGSGFDRGHMSPAANQPDPTSMAQSFALSNMVPQDPTNNRKIWSKIESDVRKYARRADGNVYIFSGPIFDNGHGTIGRNQVWVPTRLFKLVFDEASGRAWAYILPNTSDAKIEKPMGYAQFVQVTGWNLLPGNPQ